MILEPTEENISLAADAIVQGRLVGMPTETVYGVAANALDTQAVLDTFAAKGRPADNPLIVHLCRPEDLDSVAQDISPWARQLAEEFWPGPLTLVLNKQSHVPDVTTGGLDTIAVRVPRHPVARRLIEAAGVPVSAPSANPFMGLSPTRANHIDISLAKSLAMILDGGPSEIGLESTVVDLSGPLLRLLRPGGLTREQIEQCLGISIEVGAKSSRRSPGLYPRHYATKTPIRIVEFLRPHDSGIVLCEPSGRHQFQLTTNANEYAAQLYQTLYDLDHLGLSEILIQSPPTTPEWAAIWDRLTKASH